MIKIGALAITTVAFIDFAVASPLSDLTALGKEIFTDPFLSQPVGISCNTCHAPETGYTYSQSGLAAVVKSGSSAAPPPLVRNTQTIAYTAALNHSKQKPIFFWDGRADSLGEQAKGPLYASHEMNVGTPHELCNKLLRRPYSPKILSSIGPDYSCQNAPENIINIALNALAEFEVSNTVNRFSSKFDAYLKGESTLTPAEQRGLDKFSKAGCDSCHLMQPQNAPLFSDHSLHKVRLLNNKPLSARWIETFGQPLPRESGSGRTDAPTANTALFKTPTLRNTTKKPFKGFEKLYGYNAITSSLTDFIDLHSNFIFKENTNQEKDNVEATRASLTRNDIEDIIKFLITLED